MKHALGKRMAEPSRAPEPQPSSSAARLRELQETVQAQWLQRVRQELGDARDQPEPALIDNIPKIIEALADVLERGSNARPEHTAERGHDFQRDQELFVRHAEARIDWTNYKPDELMREYGILRRVLFSVLEAEHTLSTADRDRILDFIDQGIQIGSVRFTEAQQLHERLEMQYLKLIEHLVAESAQETGGSLERLLEVILKSLGAEAAAFFLYSEDRLEVTLSSATAKSRQLAELYRGALTLSAASVAMSEERTVRCTPVGSLEPSARESLEKLALKSLVWVPILARGRLPGALCLGFAEQKAFDEVEIRLLEVLGDRLALLLSSIQLQEQSRVALERAQRESDMLEVERNRLDEERRQRDQLIAAISHDLKNPLHIARLGAELIRNGATAPNVTERLADQILRSIGHSDRMIHDLLDTQRIRAGKRLPIRIEPFRMGDLVSEVVEDLKRAHGERFVIDSEPNVFGYWSWDGMRRVVENLLTNAVKYSDPQSPITVSVRVGDGNKMMLSVHNQGPSLSSEEQARIFQPFERAKSAELGGKQGWGIGLTLVKGIVDAHGGLVKVDSSPDGGTTFTVENPMDSRPYTESEAPA
jgi:signal transduction histidine kinase